MVGQSYPRLCSNFYSVNPSVKRLSGCLVERLLAVLIELRKYLDAEIDSQSGKARHIAPAEATADIDVAGQVNDQTDSATAVDDAMQKILVRLELIDHLDDILEEQSIFLNEANSPMHSLGASRSGERHSRATRDMGQFWLQS